MKNQKSKRKYQIIFFIILMITVVIGINYLTLYNLVEDSNDSKDYMTDDLLNDNDKFETVIINEKNPESTQDIPVVETDIVFESERIDKLKEYQNINSDIVGWLEIPETNISYPVLQGIDNSYYMKRNYKKKWSPNGSLFLDKDYNWNPRNTNLLIYGHNNRGTSEMFVDLLKYKDEKFYKEHQNIRFTTTEEDAIYEIISVFKSRVYYKRENDVFRYYYFIHANNKDEFDYYISESKNASLYDIDATAEYGDSLITLSTCDYSQKDGRFVVVARKKQ